MGWGVPRCLQIRIASGAILAILIAAAGCGPAPNPPTPADGEIRTGGTLIVDAPRLRSLDPLEATDVNSSSIAGEVFEGLVGYSPDDFHSIAPLLADKWAVSPDRLTWTFRLRTGLRFHDDPCFPGGRGREVTPEDVAFSIARGLRAETESVASSMRNLLLGAAEFAAGASPDLAGVEIPGPGEVRFRLIRPGNEFLHALASVAGWVVPREAVERYGSRFGRHPVGTGPFRLAGWTDEALILVRNRRYWRRDEAGIRLPYLDQVVFRNPRWVRRDERSFSDLLDGSLHLVYFTGEIQWIDFQPLVAFLRERGVRLVSIPKWNTIYYGWNMTRDNVWTRNRELRRAVALAVNAPQRSEILEPAAGLLPPGLPGCRVSQTPRRIDPEAARDLLAAAGFPGGRGLPRLEMGSMGSSSFLQDTLIEPLRRQGIEVDILAAPWKQHWEAVDRGEYEFFRGGWIADYPGAENFFSLFYSKSPVNQTGYSNPGFDRTFEELAATPVEDPAREELCTRLETILREDVPAIFLYHEKALYLIHPSVRNLEPSINPMERKFYEYVWLDRGRER